MDFSMEILITTLDPVLGPVMGKDWDKLKPLLRGLNPKDLGIAAGKDVYYKAIGSANRGKALAKFIGDTMAAHKYSAQFVHEVRSQIFSMFGNKWWADNENKKAKAAGLGIVIKFEDTAAAQGLIDFAKSSHPKPFTKEELTKLAAMVKGGTKIDVLQEAILRAHNQVGELQALVNAKSTPVDTKPPVDMFSILVNQDTIKRSNENLKRVEAEKAAAAKAAAEARAVADKKQKRKAVATAGGVSIGGLLLSVAVAKFLG